jgi:PAS domain S-box-containing protein
MTTLRDITDRDYTEEKLRQSEQRLAEAERLAHLGSWEWDLRQDRFICSDEMQRILGLDGREWSATIEALLERVTEQDRPRLRGTIESALQKSAEPGLSIACENEFSIVRPDGSVRILHCQGEILVDSYGRPERVVGVSLDITERKQVEEELRYQKALLEAQSEASIEGILVVDRAGRIAYFNRRFVQLWGIPEEVVAGRSDEVALKSVEEKLLNPQAFLARVAYLYRHPHEKSREEIQLKDGRTFERYSAPVADANGAHAGRVWYFRDITERKHAEMAQQFLSEASAQLASSIDYEVTLGRVARLAVPVLADYCAVELVDEDWRVRESTAAHADPAREESLRNRQRCYPLDPVLHHPLTDLLREGRSLLLPKTTAAGYESLATCAEHLEFLRCLHPFSVILVPLVARGRTLGLMSLAITESARRYSPADLGLAEDLARRVALAIDNAELYRAAQRAVGVRDEILAATSHELRTPLGHIKGFVSTLRQTDVDWDEATRRDFLAEIEREADRLARLVDDLLDMSRIESGGLDRSQRAPVRPVALVAGALARAPDLAAAHRLEVVVPDDLPPVEVDAAQLERVLVNLLENAAKYSPVGTPIRVSGVGVDGEVRLAVEDEGLGIPPEHLERVFERFYRITGAGLPAQPGTGLGLAISRGIVRAHGGRVWAENRPEGGARFVVALPAA